MTPCQLVIGTTRFETK